MSLSYSGLMLSKYLFQLKVITDYQTAHDILSQDNSALTAEVSNSSIRIMELEDQINKIFNITSTNYKNRQTVDTKNVYVNE